MTFISNKNKFKVLFFHSGSNNTSGPRSWILRMLPILSKNIDIVLVLLVFKYEHQNDIISLLQKHDIKIIKIYVENQSEYDVIRNILKIIADEKPEIVVPDYVHHACMTTYWVGNSGIKFVDIMRSDDPSHWQRLEEFVVGEQKCRMHGVVTVSRELFSTIKLKIPDNIQLMYCPSSVHLPLEQATWQSNSFHALYLGRIVNEQKRITDLSKALINTSLTRPWFSATIFGDGPEYASVKKLLNSVQGHKVKLGGELKLDEVYQHLLSSQALILLSEYEGLSTAVQEAMACGVPVIMRRMASGMDGVMIHGETGLILENDDELGQAVDNLFYSEPLWFDLSKNARRVAEKEFSIAKAAEKWISFLQALKPADNPELFRLPSLEEIKKVCSRHAFRRYGLSPEDVSKLMLPGRGWEPYFKSTDSSCHTWQMRRKYLYLCIENGCIGRQQATELAEELVLEIPTSIDIDMDEYNTASLLKLANNFEKSTHIFKNVLKNPINVMQKAGCYYHLGDIAMKEGDLNEAFKNFRFCLEICPEHKAAQYKLQIISNYRVR